MHPPALAVFATQLLAVAAAADVVFAAPLDFQPGQPGALSDDTPHPSPPSGELGPGGAIRSHLLRADVAANNNPAATANHGHGNNGALVDHTAAAGSRRARDFHIAIEEGIDDLLEDITNTYFHVTCVIGVTRRVENVVVSTSCYLAPPYRPQIAPLTSSVSRTFVNFLG
jgi:hypothetical protein